MTSPKAALVLAGGVGLGAYQGGAYAELHAREPLPLDWIAASSVGAMNAAVIAGNAPHDRVARLRALWSLDLEADPAAAGTQGPWRHAWNWMHALQTRTLGAPGYFTPRYASVPATPFKSVYDLSPLRERLAKLVDFGRLNAGEMRLTIAATDLESGDTVYFDTARGDRITLDHLLASAGYLPEFSPVEIDGRLLGDGGLSSNAPVEAVLLAEDAAEGERVCFVVDLFARDGPRPRSLEAALERKNDLLLANQTWKRLELHRREIELRGGATRAIVYLSYRAPAHEAGPEKVFDLSGATAADRWRAGELDMAEALRALAQQPRQAGGCALLSIRR